MKQGYNQDVTADTFEAWTVHSYAGDYNPLHDHGCRTEAGLSMILYLKVPECISNQPDPADLGGGVNINNASGVVDGYTYFNWGNNVMRDVVALRPVTEEYVKPEAGTLIIFPNWLRHSVNPFFGEGERRTLSANVNLFNNQNLIKFTNLRHNYAAKFFFSSLWFISPNKVFLLPLVILT